jgi:decaprenylphospho-beta-D-erythro-pentofuranosid-2-ulose 2-reductase
MSEARKTMLLLGGTSDIGRAVAAQYAEQGWNIILTARDMDAGERNAADLRVRHNVNVRVVKFDLFRPDDHDALLRGLGNMPDTVVSALGMLGDQTRAETDLLHAREVFVANFEGPALLLGAFAEQMAKLGSGTIVGISSVAGDRGRAANYVYGSAKAGFTAFLSGLRNRLAVKGVHVLTVKPGFVRTKMTEGMKLPPALTAAPEEVARALYRAAEVKRADLIYVQPVWRLVMAIIRTIPESRFKNMKI